MKFIDSSSDLLVSGIAFTNEEIHLLLGAIENKRSSLRKAFNDPSLDLFTRQCALEEDTKLYNISLYLHKLKENE